MISENRTAEEIKEYGIKELGMEPLKSGAVRLINEGVTTVEELAKVAYYD
jgi:type IV pilus assembly protein PilB